MTEIKVHRGVFKHLLQRQRLETIFNFQNFKEEQMFTFQAAQPVTIHALHLFSEHQTAIDTCLLRLLAFFGVADPMRLFRSAMFQHLLGIECQSHHSQGGWQIFKELF